MIKKNALVQKFKEWLNKQLPTLKEQEVLFKNVFSLVEKKETDKFVKKALRKKFNELSELAELSIEEEVMGLSLPQNKRKEFLLEKFNAEDSYEAIAKVFGAINRHYNDRDNDFTQYLDLKVQFLDYCAKNRKEIKGLAELSQLARNYRAYVLAGELEKYQMDLSKEEKDLHVLVERLNPENQKREKDKVEGSLDYYKTAQYLQKKISLYEGKTRTELLGAYQRFLKDYDDSSSMKRMWIGTTNKYLCSRKPMLEEQTQAAQSLRKPVVVKLKHHFYERADNR